MDKILRIDVGAEGGPKATVHPLGEYAGLGGRAMTSTVILKEVPADCHALGPENKLVIAPGLLSGSAANMTGRLSVGCKSPLTGTIKESNAGGSGAQALGKLGYAAVILEGERKDKDLYRLLINKDGVKIEKANDAKLMPNYPLADKVKAEFGDKVSLMSIGTAGELLMCDSSIAVTDPEFRPTRHCGRGGVGAVMGSKGIKYIVIDPAGTKNREPADPAAFKAANKKFVEGLKSHPVTGQGLPNYGTSILVNILCEAGGFPTYNFREGRWEKGAKISGEVWNEQAKARGGNPTHGCHRGCVIQCSGIHVDEKGNYVSKWPEYETTWALGGFCGLSNTDDIARLDYMMDNFGFDTIEMGATLGLAVEAGLVAFGDTEGFIKLMEEAGKDTPLGHILGSGAETFAKVYGVSRVPTVKGQAIPAYDPRAVKGVGVTYATTTMGADHTAGYAVATNILKVGGFVDPLKAEGQAELSRNLQIATAAVDATGHCVFVAFAVLDQPETFQALIDTVNAMYDMKMTADDVVALGKDILRKEREFNKAAGFGPAQDRLPRFFRTEKLPPHNTTFDVSDEELDSVFNF